MPQREYWPEPSKSALNGERRGKGYRIRSSVNPERSAIERALEEAGFTFYMPAEFAAVRNRRKAGLYETRRYALMKGYAFVAEINDLNQRRLLDVPGVRGIVASDSGHPYVISSTDLHRLRMYEHNSRHEAQAKVARLSGNEENAIRAKRKVAIRGARKKLFPKREVKLIWGDKVGREATVQAWRDQDQVEVLLSSLDAAPETITVPYEYLKVIDEPGLTGTDA